MKVSVWCTLKKNKVIIYQYGVIFLAMGETAALCHVPVGTASQLHAALLTSPNMFVPFWLGSFHIIG
jgi:hypothetical protein